MTIYHKHHIIPRHMGGSDDPSNLVEVTIEEHAELHRQLWEDLGDVRDFVAWKTLSGQMSNEEAIKLSWSLPKTDKHKEALSISVKRLYEETKECRKWGRPKGSKNKAPYSKEIIEARSGKNHPLFGKYGSDNPNFGKERPGTRSDVAERNKSNPPARGIPKSKKRIADANGKSNTQKPNEE